MNEENVSETKPKKSRLDAIKENRKCKQLPVNADKLDLKKAHIVKMAAKKIVRNRMYEQMSGPSYIMANLGKDHPDYGMSPAEHLAEKAKRSQEN